MLKRYFWLIIFIGAVAVAVLNFGVVWQYSGKVLAVFRPIFVGIFLAVVLNIPVSFFQKKVFRFKDKKAKFSLPLSIGVTYVLFFAFVGLFLYAVVPQLFESIKGLLTKVPDYMNDSEIWLSDFLLKAGVDETTVENIKQSVGDKISTLLNGLVEGAPKLLSALITGVSGFLDLFFAIILSVYMISDKKRLTSQLKRFVTAILPEKASKKIIDITTISLTVFSKFIGGQLVEAVLLGVLTFLGMIILKLPYPVLCAAIVMITNIIPLLGAYLGGIISFVLISFISFKQAVVFLIFMIILQQLENNITYPRVVGKSLGLTGFWVLSAALIGGGLFGFWGVMLGVPTVAVIYKLLGRRVGENPAPNMLIPEFLNEAAKEASDNTSDKSGGKGNGDGAP